MSSWRIALALVPLLALSGRAVRVQAQPPALAELVVPVEDLGAGRRLREETETRDALAAAALITDGSYPSGTVHARVQERLSSMASAPGRLQWPPGPPASARRAEPREACRLP